MTQDRNTLIIGSRESVLAVRQSELVLDYLRRNCPQRQFELLTMKTTGDRILAKRLDEIGGKGLFVKELDQALRDKRTDLSVHSLKDMPAEIPEDLPVIGFSEREDPRDVLVLPEGISDPSQMDLTKPIGTSSRRRMLQAQELFPQARFESVRGNVLTSASSMRDSTVHSSWRQRVCDGWGWRSGSAGFFRKRRSFPPQDRAYLRCREEEVRTTLVWTDLSVRSLRSQPRRKEALYAPWAADAHHPLPHMPHLLKQLRRQVQEPPLRRHRDRRA